VSRAAWAGAGRFVSRAPDSAALCISLNSHGTNHSLASSTIESTVYDFHCICFTVTRCQINDARTAIVRFLSECSMFTCSVLCPRTCRLSLLRVISRWTMVHHLVLLCLRRDDLVRRRFFFRFSDDVGVGNCKTQPWRLVIAPGSRCQAASSSSSSSKMSTVV